MYIVQELYHSCHAVSLILHVHLYSSLQPHCYKADKQIGAHRTIHTFFGPEYYCCAANFSKTKSHNQYDNH